MGRCLLVQRLFHQYGEPSWKRRDDSSLCSATRLRAGLSSYAYLPTGVVLTRARARVQRIADTPELAPGSVIEDEESLKQFVADQSASHECSYCGRRDASELIAAPVDEVIGFIVEAIRTEYTDANGTAGWDQEDYTYTVPTTDTWDLLFDLGLASGNRGFFDDITSTIHDITWCAHSPYRLSDSDALRWSWQDFSEYVKHSGRYFVLNTPFPHRDDEEVVSPSDFLETLNECVEQAGLFVEIPEGSSFYRARVADRGRTYNGASELAPPPKEYALASNRMSPAGVPAFYGARDLRTAVIETYDISGGKQQTATVGEFLTLRKLRILDLTAVPEVPSLFDAQLRHLRSTIMFLKHFAKEVSKPIHHDGREHIEYVPTQVVTEYFRLVARIGDAVPVDGIQYKSSRKPDGQCCVLFLKNDDCINDGDDETGKTLKLVNSTVVHVDLPDFLQ